MQCVVVFQVPRILFSEQHIICSLIGAKRAQAFFFFFACFLQQHLACHLIYMLEITNSTNKKRPQDVREREEKQYNLLTIYECRNFGVFFF